MVNMKELVCSNESCSNIIYREQRAINAAERKGQANFFCSFACRGAGRSPETTEKMNQAKRELAIRKFNTSINRSPGQGPNGDCWEWMGTTDKGYGIASYNAKVWQAHRLSYTFSVGEIPEGMVLLHSCDNPPCVNPAHLTPGSRGENQKDMVDKGRHIKGEGTHGAKLTEEQVLEIRSKSSFTIKELADEYGVSTRTISRVLNGYGWTHVSTEGCKSKMSRLPELEYIELNQVKFEKNFIKSNGCWLWQGSLGDRGYGSYKENYILYKAHRAAYLIYKKVDIPAGILVRHLCSNKACVNPDHLELGTYIENSLDSKLDGALIIGSLNNKAKLNEEQVLEIKKLLLDKSRSAKSIADLYGVTKWAIFDIRYGKSWQHVKLPGSV